MSPSHASTSDPRPGELAGAFLVAVLVHLAVLFLLAFWSALSPAAAAPAEPEEILVQLAEEPVPPPAPAVAPPPPPPPAAEESAPEPEEARAEAVRDDSLLGWKTRGDEPGEALRPPGPEAEVHGVPPPEEESPEPEEEPPRPSDEPEGSPRDGSSAPESTRHEPSRPLAESPEPVAPPSEARGAEPEPLPSEGLVGSAAPQEEPEGVGRTETRPAEPSEPGAPEPLPEVIRPVPPPDGSDRRDELPPGRPRVRPFDLRDAKIGGGFGDLQFESRDYNWSEYSTKVYFAIYRTWLNQLWQAARRGSFSRDQTLGRLPDLDGQCRITFVIDRQGNVSDVEILDPSAVPTLDQASAAALLRAILPPLPADFPRPRERATFRFLIRGFPNESTLEWSLYRSRQAGEF